jgi:hypothetical protein
LHLLCCFIRSVSPFLNLHCIALVFLSSYNIVAGKHITNLPSKSISA